MNDKEFFAELFMKPEPLSYEYHPSDRVLRAYLKGQLHDEWQISEEFLPRLRRAELDGEWGLSEVSLHLLTCGPCRERIARMRAAELAQMERARARTRGRLVRLRLRGWWSSITRSLARPWPKLVDYLTARLSPFMLGLSVGSGTGTSTGYGYAPPAGLSLLYRWARGGAELQGGALLEGRPLAPAEAEEEPDY